MKSDLPEIGWMQRILFLLGRREIFEIEGESMSPTLIEGDLALINYQAEIKEGDIILAHHPFEESSKLIRRVSKITPKGKYFLVGDNPAKSTDSRNFGEIPATDILGKVEAKIRKSKH